MKNQILRYLKRNAIIVTIGLVLVLAVANLIVSVLEMRASGKFEKTSKEVAAAKNRLSMVNTHVNLADMSFRGFFIVEDQQLLHPFTDQVLLNYGRNYDTLYQILERQGFEASKVLPVKAKVAEYMTLIQEMVKLRKQQRLEEVVAILKADPGYEVWKVYDAFVKEATVFEDALEASVLEEYENISRIKFYLQILLILFGIPTLCISLNRIRKNNKVIDKLFLSIEENNKKYIFNPNLQETTDVNQKLIINALIENLKKISLFVKGITVGDYSVQWEGINDSNKDYNKNNIVGDLINMKEQMKMVKLQDERRLWITEGISKFSEIIRTHQHHIEDLSFQVVSNLVKYIDANQGGMFILNDTEEGKNFLELTACYAYQRKRYLEKRIEIGQGLIGQAYLEKDIVYITEIPDHYVSITSGLGESNPKSLIIIPLIYNEKVEGVIEIASFHALDKHEIDFLQKIGEYVASAIASVKVNERTNILLQNTREQAEEMRSQEEEMRQNMEELQATQEEVQRRTQEYQEVIESNQKEIENLRLELRKHTSQISMN